MEKHKLDQIDARNDVSVQMYGFLEEKATAVTVEKPDKDMISVVSR